MTDVIDIRTGEPIPDQLRPPLVKSRRMAPVPLPPSQFQDLRERAETPQADPMEKARVLVEQMRRDPLVFAREWLFLKTEPWVDDRPESLLALEQPGLIRPLWSKQVEILRAVVEHKKVAVKSGHGVGKTFIAALAALTMLYVFRAIVITTAPTFRQVRRLLWGEIHSIWHRAAYRLRQKGMPALGGDLHQVELNITPKWYMLGFSTDDPENAFQGFHEERIVLIGDEACGLDNRLYESAEGILTSEHSYVLLIGNPTDPTSEFAEKFEPGSGYHPITISCLDSPNVRHGVNVYPKLVAHDWPSRMKRKWGEDSPMYRSRVLAEFPSEREDTLIPYKYLQAALDRELPEDSPLTSFGADIARFGDDRTVVGSRQSNGRFRILEAVQGKPTTAVAGRIIRMWKDLVSGPWGRERDEGARDEEEAPPQVPINVDDIGLGGGVTDIIQEEELPCNGINVSESPDWDVSEEEEDYDKFLNLRAQLFWRLRMAFVRGVVDIDDEELARELVKLRYEYTSKGKIKIISKKEFKKLYKFSPDRADCMMLAWAKTEADNTRDMARWL